MVAKAKGKTPRSTDKHKGTILIRGLSNEIKRKFHAKCVKEETTMTARIKELILEDIENGNGEE